MLPYTVITPAAIKPILVDATLRLHLRLSATDTSEDDLLDAYVDAATQYIERYIGYPLMTQVVELKLTKQPTEPQDLTGSINDIITYTIDDGSDIDGTSLSVEKYGILSQVRYDSFASGSLFKFKCNAGYTVDNIPEDIKQACRLLVMHMYEVRESVKVSAPDTVTDILDRHLLY